MKYLIELALILFCCATTAQTSNRDAAISRCFFVYAPLYEVSLKHTDEKLKVYALQRLMYVRGHLDSHKDDPAFKKIFQSGLLQNKQAGVVIENQLTRAIVTSNIDAYNAEVRKGDTCDLELGLTKTPTSPSGKAARSPASNTSETTVSWRNPESGISVELEKMWTPTLGTGETVGSLYREVASLKSANSLVSISRYGVTSSRLIESEEEREEVFRANPIVRRIDSPATTYVHKSWSVIFHPSRVFKNGGSGFEILFGDSVSWSISANYTLGKNDNRKIISDSCAASAELMLSAGFPSRDWIEAVLLPRCNKVANRRNA